MIARLALPWYLNFYMSWRHAPGAMMVNYEDLTSKPVEVIRDILRFSNAAVAGEDVEDAITKVRARQSSRLNVGLAGRGASLQPATLQTILDLINLYPEASDDPYIRSTREQAMAALAGLPPPERQVVAPPTTATAKSRAPRRGLRKSEKRFLVHWVVPALLIIVGMSYWIWPYDLIPDHSAYGYVDDATVMLVSSFLAGVFRYKKI